MKTELKPCPFCGGEAVMLEGNKIFNKQICRPTCTRCGATIFVWYSTKQAIEAWNRRYDETKEINKG